MTLVPTLLQHAVLHGMKIMKTVNKVEMQEKQTPPTNCPTIVNLIETVPERTAARLRNINGRSEAAGGCPE